MKSKKFISIFILSFLIWILLAIPEKLGAISTQEVIAGIIVASVVSIFCVYLSDDDSNEIKFRLDRVIAFIIYIPVFFIELLKANISMAKICLAKKIEIKPVIIKIPTSLKEKGSLTLLANSITLTPGTISVDIVEEDKENYLYIHWIDVGTAKEEEFSEIIKGKFEPYIRRISEK